MATFVLAAFILFHSERTVSTELIKYARDLWPLRLQGGCMNTDPMQGRAPCYQVNSYTAELGYCSEKWFRRFPKKIYSPVHAIRDADPCTKRTCMGLGTHRGLRLPYVHVQCMPIWVPGSWVLESPFPRSTEYSVPTQSCVATMQAMSTYFHCTH